jgi:four helix bundle protein
MDEHAFKAKTKRLALQIIRLVETLPRKPAGQIIGRQLLRSGTSVGANYRAACRSRSTPDMLARLGVVEEEADETLFWLELIVDAGLLPAAAVADLTRETSEVLAMTVASIKTLRSRRG